MPRFFTLSQASELLPEVEASLREAIHFYSEHADAEQWLEREVQRILLAGGALVDRRDVANHRASRETSALALKGAIEKIHSLGCQVKDLETGLVDFPTLYHGKEVLLCWRLGEDAIRFWHGLEEGFRGRKPIDQEFIENHAGDKPN
jgi:hypothetical protein